MHGQHATGSMQLFGVLSLHSFSPGFQAVEAIRWRCRANVRCWLNEALETWNFEISPSELLRRTLGLKDTAGAPVLYFKEKKPSN